MTANKSTIKDLMEMAQNVQDEMIRNYIITRLIPRITNPSSTPTLRVSKMFATTASCIRMMKSVASSG